MSTPAPRGKDGKNAKDGTETTAAWNSRLAAFEALQKQLALDETKARAWQEKVRESRR